MTRIAGVEWGDPAAPFADGTALSTTFGFASDVIVFYLCFVALLEAILVNHRGRKTVGAFLIGANDPSKTMNSSSVVTKQLPCGNLQQELHGCIYRKTLFQSKQHSAR